MADEVARIVIGLPLAASWPLTVPQLAASRTRASVAAALSALYILVPLLPEPKAFALLALTAGLAFAAAESGSQSESPAFPLPPVPILTVSLLAIVAATLTDLDLVSGAIETILTSDQVALGVIGFTACVFLGGSFVAWILSPFTAALEGGGTSRPTLANAGRYIGWFERAVLFAFVMGGAPEAAAIALAAKSFARFPTFREHQEGFAEYFLIGSLASIAVAVAVAAATRGALGIGPF